MALAATVVSVVLSVTLVIVLLGYLVHKNADRHDGALDRQGGRR
jgi:hypothetical protein